MGSHYIPSLLDAEKIDSWATAVDYQLIHALVLYVISFQMDRAAISWVLLSSGWLMVVGVILFSGSIYLLVLDLFPWVWPATPAGGGSLIIGWFLMFFYWISFASEE